MRRPICTTLFPTPDQLGGRSRLLTPTLILLTIFLVTSAIKHLFTLGCGRSGGATMSLTDDHLASARLPYGMTKRRHTGQTVGVIHELRNDFLHRRASGLTPSVHFLDQLGR